MSTFFYLRVWSSGEIDSQTIVTDRSVHPFSISDVGLELSDWPADDLFQSWPAFFASCRLSSKIIHGKYTGIDFQQVSRINPDFNFKAFYPGFNTDQYLWLNINGELGKDDFALFNRMYLVVSEKALEFLRDNHVTHAESDEITIPFIEYFNSDRKNFWMEIERKKLEERGLLAK